MKGRPTKWTPEMLEKLVKEFPDRFNKDIAKDLNIGWRTVVRKARELNLEKSPTFRDNIDFKTLGQEKRPEPWNKGMKGLKIPGSEKTWFKKGHNLSPKIPKEVRSQARLKLIAKEKVRVKYGLPRLTKIRLKF
ncbi:MAG: hypothetical protein ACK40G_13810 [Cytophagaceae bacterium]